jgi:hypothetical protein
MDSVRRPKYFNERDRRFKGDEEERLLSTVLAQGQLAGPSVFCFWQECGVSLHCAPVINWN